MNVTTLAASCALICALPFPLLSVHPNARAEVASITDETTIVIRYDPEAIFLTHDLVAPLCIREVRLSSESFDGEAGKLVMDPMDSNRLQPKGVFVGRIRAEWNADAGLSAEQREASLNGALDQLRSALASRLVHSRRNQIEYRVAILEDMVNQRQKVTDERSRELARADELTLTYRELEQMEQIAHEREFELRAAQQELLIGTASIREIESKLNQATAKVDGVAKDLKRIRSLVKEGLKSELELQAAEARLDAAENTLSAELSQLETQRMQVEQRSSLVAMSEKGLAEVVARMSDLQERANVLASRTTQTSSAELKLGLATHQSQLAELSVELQRARAELATIVEVTVERW